MSLFQISLARRKSSSCPCVRSMRLVDCCFLMFSASFIASCSIFRNSSYEYMRTCVNKVCHIHVCHIHV